VDPPSGTVTFLFTDIEGSTRLWESVPEAMAAALARHDEILRAAITTHGGFVFSTGGDGVAAAFGRAADAVAAAVLAQGQIGAEAWPHAATIRVRMGLNTGEVEERGGDYFGPAVNRAARIMAAGHGGQVLLSATTAALVGAAELVELGAYEFAGLASPERVFQIGAEQFPPLRSMQLMPSNLPGERSVFVGRERELAAVAGKIRSNRVLTLTGVGGVGKTRLAIQAAAGVAGEFPGGVWLAELAPLIDASLVGTTVAAAIGVPMSPSVDPSELVCRFLSQRRALVVLDNCEHVIGVAADLVDRVLAAAPRARVLATSREPLGVAAESVWRVPSLSVDADVGVGDAVALFAQRAAQIHRDFVLDDATTKAVRAICERLDGIPLAIELAAARAKVLSVQQISARLDERFRLLTRGGRTAVPRQQTLQGAMDWSYELLAPGERDLFDALGVFAGDLDLAAVAAVSGLDEFEALDLLSQLVDKSMLEVDPSRDRYRLLETLRQYAWDRLAATERLAAAREAHARWFVSLAGQQAARMEVPGQQVNALDRLEADYDNLRAALAYLIETHQAESAARMARCMLGLFNIRHPREGLGWFQQVEAIATDLPPNTRARLLADTGYVAMCAGDGHAHGRYAQAAIDVAGADPPATAHWLLAMLHSSRGDQLRALKHAREAFTLSADPRERTMHATAAGTMVRCLALLGERAEALELIPTVIDIAEDLANPAITGSTYSVLAEALLVLELPTEATVMITRGFVHVDAGGPITSCITRVMYALVADDPATATEMLRHAIPIARHQLSGYFQFGPLVGAADLMFRAGRNHLAARLFGAYQHNTQHAGESWSVYDWHQKRILDQLAKLMSPSALEEELDRGAQLDPDQALDLAEAALASLVSAQQAAPEPESTPGPTTPASAE
jgi:predicted ATPase/class 3 adenylate cyclase